MTIDPEDVFVIAVVRESERYVFVFNEATHQECLQKLGRFAINPELSFNWYDAACVALQVRKKLGITK